MRLFALLAAAMLVALHLAALVAGFLAPYDPALQSRDHPYAPPSRVHFVDEVGTFHLRPFVYGLRPTSTGGYEEVTQERYPLRFFERGEPYRLFGWIPASRRLVSVASPGRLFVMGTDGLGRDQFSRIAHGASVSLFAGLLGAMTALLLGGLVGAVAGFYGGRLDQILMRTTEVFMALPWLYLLIAARAIQPLDAPASRSFLVIVLILGLFGWPRSARLTRGVAATVSRREHVQAARGFGASNLYLLSRHVAPRLGSVLRTQGALLVPQFVLAEVGLSFLGVGIQPPVPSWGNLLTELQQFHVLSTGGWWLAWPAVALMLVTLAYHLLARGATVSSS